MSDKYDFEQHLSISKDTGLLFCAQQPVAPRTLIKDNLSTNDRVEAEIHTDRTQVTIMLDRNETGMTEDLVSFALAPKCSDFFQDPRYCWRTLRV
jgi:hypothetical protein